MSSRWDDALQFKKINIYRVNITQFVLCIFVYDVRSSVVDFKLFQHFRDKIQFFWNKKKFTYFFHRRLKFDQLNKTLTRKIHIAITVVASEIVKSVEKNQLVLCVKIKSKQRVFSFCWRKTAEIRLYTIHHK